MTTFVIFILIILALVLLAEFHDYLSDRKFYRLIFITIATFLLSWGLDILINHRF